MSFSTYCTGNEGHLGTPLDREIYQLAKKLDPTRLMLHQDGGTNLPGSSDFSTGPALPWPPGAAKCRQPFFAHEYLNLATDEDPRLMEKYVGAVRPPVAAGPVKEELRRAGLTWEWGMACHDAGNRLQSVYQKRGLESARLDPNCGGYIYWTIVDVGSPAAQGLLNQFWEPKASTAAFFRQFNGPTAVLAKMSPDGQILSEGDTLRVVWRVSHFGPHKIEGQTLNWRLTAGQTVLASGSIAGVAAVAGDVKALGNTAVTIPPLARPAKAQLIAEFAGCGVKNSWDLWLFPRHRPETASGHGIAAPERIRATLAGRIRASPAWAPPKPRTRSSQ